MPMHAGRIDVLINNAAVARFGPLLEQPLDEVREVLDADVVGLLALSQVTRQPPAVHLVFAVPQSHVAQTLRPRPQSSVD